MEHDKTEGQTTSGRDAFDELSAYANLVSKNGVGTTTALRTLYARKFTEGGINSKTAAFLYSVIRDASAVENGMVPEEASASSHTRRILTDVLVGEGADSKQLTNG